MDAISALANFLAQKVPFLLVVFAIMGSLRAVNKPLFAAARAYVLSTKSTKDDEVLAKVEASKAYALVCKVLDYVASIKVGTEAPVVQAAKQIEAEKKA